jgi:hypothetical protein
MMCAFEQPYQGLHFAIPDGTQDIVAGRQPDLRRSRRGEWLDSAQPCRPDAAW